MILDDATRIRVIIALLGIESKELAKRMNVTPNTVTYWRTGRTSPQEPQKAMLAKLCQEHGIGFSPSGMPFPIADVMIFKEKQNV